MTVTPFIRLERLRGCRLKGAHGDSIRRWQRSCQTSRRSQPRSVLHNKCRQWHPLNLASRDLNCAGVSFQCLREVEAARRYREWRIKNKPKERHEAVPQMCSLCLTTSRERLPLMLPRCFLAGVAGHRPLDVSAAHAGRSPDLHPRADTCLCGAGITLSPCRPSRSRTARPYGESF